MGPNDDEILGALEDFIVKYNGHLRRVEMTFGDNRFFSDKVLWAQEMPDDSITFSGVHWKEGMAPVEDDEEGGDAKKSETHSGMKRSREESSKGPSMFSFFENVNEEDYDMEEDEEAEELEELMDDRRELLDCLSHEIFEDPFGCLAANAVDEEDEEGEEEEEEAQDKIPKKKEAESKSGFAAGPKASKSYGK